MDSHQLAPFTEEDYEFLEIICQIASEVF
ncbi:MAG: hypothetical protein P1S60_02685 [Anaerolineae bacterium]|nr:hypothetical protein [Anaerolineae bacterium]